MVEDGDRELNTVQTHLIKLSGEYRALEELQLRQEKAIELVIGKADDAHLKISAINEHFKAFGRTIEDFTVKVNQMYIMAEKLKEDIHKIQLVLENIDGNRTRCADRFGDIDEEMTENKDQQKAIKMGLSSLKSKTVELENTIVAMKTMLKDMKDTIEPMSKAHQHAQSVVIFFKIVGAVVIAVLTIAGGLKALGVF